MKLPSGEILSVGDKIELWPGKLGVVVCSVDTNQYSAVYKAEEWSYLGKGVVVETEEGEVFHYPSPDEDLRLIRPIG